MKFLKEVWDNLKFTWKYVKSQKINIIGFAICNIVMIIISVIVPVISAKIIVNLTSNNFINCNISSFNIPGKKPIKRWWYSRIQSDIIQGI